MKVNFSLNNFENINNLKIVQHNCRKFTNVMQIILETSTKNSIDIVLIQEPWINHIENANNYTISHSNYICIIPKIANKNSRVAAFINKCNKRLICTPRIDIIEDPDVQILEISINDINNMKIINIYNQKNQDQNIQN